uniref:hypothetical protein n=1 Tax=Exserohilum turcicum TaxID=93612 RepID=UPI002000CB6B
AYLWRKIIFCAWGVGLGIGKIYKHGKEGVQYRVESKKELLILIEHFDKYPLTTKKGKDFLCFVFFFST